MMAMFGVIQRGQQLRLAFKARQPFRVAAEYIGEDFNGDLPVQVRVLGAIDFAHAATAELVHDLEMRNSLADLGHAGLPYGKSGCDAVWRSHYRGNWLFDERERNDALLQASSISTTTIRQP